MDEPSAAVMPPLPFEPDPVVEAYKHHVDRTLLRQNLQRSVAERCQQLVALQALAEAAREAGRGMRGQT